MHAEVSSAASHLSTLLRTRPSSPRRLEEFKTVLGESLEARYSRHTWTSSDPEAGSAARALHWQPGPGGEGCSSPLSKACEKLGVAFGEKEEWTLWIDPGCVAIRDGPGPGRVSASTSSSSISGSGTSFTPTRGGRVQHEGSIRVLYGTMPRSNAPRTAYASASLFPASRSNDFALPSPTSRAAIIRRPGAVMSSSAQVPSVNVCPSTPGAVATAQYQPVHVNVNASWCRDAGAPSLGYQLASIRRQPSSRPSSGDSNRSSSSSTNSSRSDSNGSTAYSALSLSGLQSLDGASSAGTSIPATSPMPSTMSWEKCDSDAAGPQDGQTSPPATTAFSTRDFDAVNDLDLHGLGLDDVAFEDEVGPEDAISAAGDAVDEVEDERHDEGDDTLRPLDGEDAADTTVGAVAIPLIKPSQSRASISSHARTRSTASTASSGSVTSFDNGNVKVLGGGVKLGGSSSSSTTSRAGRSRAHSNASNGSGYSGSGGYGHHGQQHQQQQQQMYPQAGSAFTRTHVKNRSSVNVNARTGGWAAQQQQQQQQHFLQQQQQNGLGLSGMDPLSAAAAASASYSYEEAQRRSNANALAQRLEDARYFQQQPQQQQQPQWSAVPPPFIRTMSYPPPMHAEPLTVLPLAKRRNLAPPLPTLGLPGAQHPAPLRSTRSSGSLKTQAVRSPYAAGPGAGAGAGTGSALPSPALQGFLSRSESASYPLRQQRSSSSAATSSTGEEEEEEGEEDEDDEVASGSGSGEGDDSLSGGASLLGSGGGAGASTSKRTRTRGRRTRGRGTGRAARRAAAGLSFAGTSAGAGAGVSPLPSPPVPVLGLGLGLPQTGILGGAVVPGKNGLPSPPIFHQSQQQQGGQIFYPQHQHQQHQQHQQGTTLAGMRMATAPPVPHSHPVQYQQQAQRPHAHAHAQAHAQGHPMHASLPPIPTSAHGFAHRGPVQLGMGMGGGMGMGMGGGMQNW
ncbi:hypothetical protein BCV69DRAFT_301211 [Microstroma glucosiphilum]|uniref:Anti-proliferative protein domain-containing protein n=1 Tax=Pseudomicrostroma glucosiphilum TaxID=1684307 RepID=A0A316TYQ3_9BASI|nr:hypothetical protein BCV69DRAFT_301211 [Pseudomicrostroma glucosiphilum]PWN18409.1 hypothetical protein BCV69DRAFT_301211 [Pseudomicrostroma glucosiphilum]